MSESKSQESGAGSSSVLLDRPSDLLRLIGVDKHFGGVHALKAVDFSVRAGEVHAIVGENGAGKSTLVGVAAGTVVADHGTVCLGGAVAHAPTANWSRANGLAVVYQEPALIPDLTVAENMRLGVPEAIRPSAVEEHRWAKEQLAPWHEIFEIDPGSYIRDLGAGERFVVEISRSVAAEPSVLILDEPTEHLMPAAVEALFSAIHGIVARGCSVVYISHRVREVKRIADRITVLRDGAVRGTHHASDLSEQQIVDLIVGRKLEARFPDKPGMQSDVLVRISDFSGDRFSGIDLEIKRGEIVGLGGIDGNGQREFLRALAGLLSAHGDVIVDGRVLRTGSPAIAAQAGIVYVSNDRRREGMLTGLGIGDNLAVRALHRVSRSGFLSTRRLADMIGQAVATFGIKIGSPRDPIETLSGGNQQKVMMARAMLTEPVLVLADEPSQGVDVGARAEIYRLLRQTTEQGAAVLMVSSDASELEGLCDRVVVLSRGQIVASLSGDQVREREITKAAVTTTTTTLDAAEIHRGPTGLRRVFEHDTSPSSILGALVIALGIVAVLGNQYYLTPRNMMLVLPLAAILIFFSLGQQLVMMTGGIDLSVGPLAGLVSVVASFILMPGGLPTGAGLLILVLIAAGIGVLNWVLIDVFGIGPIIATLVTYTGIQGVALLLRPTPGGTFNSQLIEIVSMRIGVIPVSLVLAVVLALLFESMLYFSMFGLRLRSTGSAPGVAGKLAVSQRKVRFAAYVACSLLALLGGLALLPQLGSGNATGGTLYSLSSITAVVLGGASIFGGRGSFIGALLGSLLIIQVNTVVQFLGLTAYWQDWVLGGLTIIAVAVYSNVRSGGVRTR